MKIKTSELVGPALDWAVAKAGGYADAEEWKVCTGAKGERYLVARKTLTHWPSRNWEQGGPIIEREGISLEYLGFDVPPYWIATSKHLHFPKKFGAIGTTPLIAAMRCYVASQLGDEVDIPEELT